jgi:hypothetical protein
MAALLPTPPPADELVEQPHSCGPDHQARTDQQEGAYPLSADYLVGGQGEPREQQGACQKEGEYPPHRSAHSRFNILYSEPNAGTKEKGPQGVPLLVVQH